VISITPADGDKTVSPDSFKGITVATSSQLDPVSITTANIKLGIGTSTNIVGTISATPDGKGFQFVPTAKLSYAQLYDNFTVKGVKDILGKVLPDFKSGFTTTVVQCFAPNVWDGTNCNPPTNAGWPPANITPIGVGVAGANKLPAGCTSFTQQCFKDAIASGLVKVVASGGTDSTGDTVVWEYFQNNNGNWEVRPVYAKNGTFASIGDIGGGYLSEIDKIWGSAKGVIYHAVVGNVCYEVAYNKDQNSWVINGGGVGTPITCPL